jgi:hypothetical protein
MDAWTCQENWFRTSVVRPAANSVSKRFDAFSDLPVNVNGDDDQHNHAHVVSEIKLVENMERAKVVEKHLVESGSPIEFAFLVDLDNDGRARELLHQFGSTKPHGLVRRGWRFVKRT